MGAPLDLINENGKTALHEAISRGFIHIAVALLDRKYEGQGTSIKKRCEFGYSPLCLACDAQYVDIARMLLARGARQDVPNNYGCTGLHLTTYYNNKVIVRLLAAAPFFKEALEIRASDIRHGAGVQLMTPLEMAIFYDVPEIEAILRENGAI